jgi:hypothetical protein
MGCLPPRPFLKKQAAYILVKRLAAVNLQGEPE